MRTLEKLTFRIFTSRDPGFCDECTSPLKHRDRLLQKRQVIGINIFNGNLKKNMLIKTAEFDKYGIV